MKLLDVLSAQPYGPRPMSTKLGETLRRIRGIAGATLRDVEKGTGVSNAYLSQLENGNTFNPSPLVLHKLAKFYGVPYESLMDAAGYLDPSDGEPAQRTKGGPLEAALLAADLTEEEQIKVAEYVEFLRSLRRKVKK